MKFSAAIVILTAAGASAFQAPTAFTRHTTSLNAIMPVITGRSSLDPAVIDKYNNLPFPPETLLAEYVWVDAEGNTRSKTRTLQASKVRFSFHRVLHLSDNHRR
jgi:glutamine synthetase